MFIWKKEKSKEYTPRKNFGSYLNLTVNTWGCGLLIYRRYSHQKPTCLRYPCIGAAECDAPLQEANHLHDIGLSAGRGEVIGVVGHNGAGKTTFSRALCGLHKDCDGQFLWERKPIERKARLKRSYMVMQDVNYELFADSVEAECSFGIRNPDQTLVNATWRNWALPHTGSAIQHAFRRSKATSSSGCQHDLWERLACI